MTFLLGVDTADYPSTSNIPETPTAAKSNDADTTTPQVSLQGRKRKADTRIDELIDAAKAMASSVAAPSSTCSQSQSQSIAMFNFFRLEYDSMSPDVQKKMKTKLFELFTNNC